jgi:RNA polymerase sigma factor (sigma-70 family)
MASVANSLDIATAVAGTNQGNAQEELGGSPTRFVEPGHQPGSNVARLQPEDRELAILMQAAQSGDANAYTRLLRSITPRLRGYTRRRWPSLTREDVEDLVQDVLLSVHAARATYSPDRPFMPWLFTIAARRLADRARRHARQVAHEVQGGQLPDASSGEAGAFGGDTFGDAEALRKAVQHLPRKSRIAIEMLKLRELSLKEGSAASGMSTGALRASIHRALPMLREALQGGACGPSRNDGAPRVTVLQ